MVCAKTTSTWLVAIAAAALMWSLATESADAQILARAVGGVAVDVEGVVSNPQVGELKELQAAWQAGLKDVPADLNAWTDLRFVSVRQLEAQIAAARVAGEDLPDSVRFLAGLQRIRYVLIYPERDDIVLAGPAEGWRVDTMGNIVGATTGRPVLLLDDLMVALRTAESSNQTGISCSIDPTPEGLQRMRQISGQLSAQGGPQLPARQMEEAVGPQTISVTGVPATSHFARVLVAADFRMKRLAMDFEPAPVDGVPSFLQLAKSRRGGMNYAMPRWWLAPMYEPLQRDQNGLAWELRGQGVRCLTEQEYLDEAGQKRKANQADATAQKWADNFTSKFEQLAHEDSAFGSLRNVMDLAVVAALLVKERLLERSGLEAVNLMRDEPLLAYPAPRTVPSQASFVKAGRSWIITVSGGVQIFPWQVADETQVAAELASARPEPPATTNGWYWQQ